MAFLDPTVGQQETVRFTALAGWAQIDQWVRDAADPYRPEDPDPLCTPRAEDHVLGALLASDEATLARLKTWVKGGLDLGRFAATPALLQVIERAVNPQPQAHGAPVLLFLLHHGVQIHPDTVRHVVKHGWVEILDALDRRDPALVHQRVTLPYHEHPANIMTEAGAWKRCPWYQSIQRNPITGAIGEEADASLLHVAAREGQPGMIEALLARGLDPNHVAGQGTSPLHLALLLPRRPPLDTCIACVTLLLEAGASLDPASDQIGGHTPKTLAHWTDCPTLVTQIHRHEVQHLRQAMTGSPSIESEVPRSRNRL